MRRSGILMVLILTALSEGHAFVKDSVMIPMRDSVRLYTNIYFPDDTSDFPLPVILMRTPYGADEEGSNMSDKIAELTDSLRYIFVIEDMRGRHESEGEDSLFREDGWGDLQDGYDTIEWIAEQDWCNGKVATYGASARGITQYLAAGAVPPHLVTCFPINAAWSMYEFAYQGGEFRKADVEAWVNDNSRPEMLQLVKENYNYSDSMWGTTNCNTRVDYIKVPMFHIEGWMDMFLPGGIEAFYQLQYNGATGARGNQKLVVGPWTHTTTGTRQCGDVIFPENAEIDYFHEYAIPWFNYWLKDSANGIMDIPDLSLYLMGPTDTSGYWNRWLYFNEWPFNVEDTLKLYLADSLKLLPTPGNTGSVSYVFDPSNPVPTRGGHNLTLDAGFKEQTPVIYGRSDVLLFVLDSVTSPFDIFGDVKLKLYASSDRLDTDFTGKLVDIYPDGRKMLITDGILMARHRNGFDREDFMTPGQVYEFTIDLNYTAYTMVPGHKLGLAISSSNYSKYAVNPNTNQPVNASTDTLTATNTIHYGTAYPSVLLLPIRPASSGLEEKVAVKPSRREEGIKWLFTTDGAVRLPTEANEGTVTIYSLTGRRIGEVRLKNGHLKLPHSGVFIVKSGNRERWGIIYLR